MRASRPFPPASDPAPDEAAPGAPTEVPIPPDGLLLHLGSGPHAEPGWVNVDKSWTARVSRVRPLVVLLARAGVLNDQQRQTRWPREVVQRDLSKPLPWPDRSARAIYSSHMVEHFEPLEAQRLLRECLRVLKPGGVLRLVLPDLEACVRHYQREKEAGNPRAADDFVGAHFYTAAGNFYGEARHLSRTRRLAIRLLHRPHQWMYDAESMQALLEDVGFSGVRECRYRSGACPDLQTLETRKDEIFSNSSFYVEAFKP